VYLETLKSGRIRARDLSSNLGINRVSVYRALRDLKKKGMLQVTPLSPYYFMADLEASLGRVVEDKEKDLASLRKKKEDLAAWLTSISIAKSVPSESKETFYRLLFGGQHYAILEKLLARCDSEVMRVISSNGLKLNLENDVPLWESKCKASGVKIRVVSEIVRSNAKEARQYSSTVELRHLSGISTSLRYTVFDEREMLLTLSAPANETSRLAMLWTNNAVLLEAAIKDFNRAWDSSTEASHRLRELEERESESVL